MFLLEEQLLFLHFLQTIRGEFIDGFFRFLNFFDSDLYAMLLIGAVWLLFSPTWGKRLAFVITLDALVNYGAKIFFALPRPFVFDTSLALVQPSTSFGFPSGGAEMSFLFGCFLAFYWKNKWAWPLGFLYVAIISFSRLFLGVHFPADVIGGWVLGSVVFFCFTQIHLKIEGWVSLHPHLSCLMTLIAVGVCAEMFPQPRIVELMKVLAVLTIGTYAIAKQPWRFFSFQRSHHQNPIQNLRSKILNRF